MSLFIDHTSLNRTRYLFHLNKQISLNSHENHQFEKWSWALLEGKAKFNKWKTEILLNQKQQIITKHNLIKIISNWHDKTERKYTPNE